MKTLGIIVILLTHMIVSCQNRESQSYDSLKGKKLVKLSDIMGFKNYCSLKGLSLGDNSYCFSYQDTITLERAIIYQQKINDDDDLKYVIKDVILINKLEANKYIEFGTIENANVENLLVAIEEYDGKNLPLNSKKIFKAWIYNTQKERFEETEVNDLYRINEGYFKKSR